MSLSCVLCIYSIVSIVRLSGNNLGDEGLDILTKSLTTHTRLQDLRCVSLIDVHNITSPLFLNVKLIKYLLYSVMFRVGWNSITDDGLKSLVPVIQRNSRLETLE